MRLMFWIGSLLVVALGLWLLGVSLPETREATLSRTVQAPPALVRATLVDIGSQPAWRAGVKAVEGTLDQGWTELTEAGERIQFQMLEATETRIVLSFDSARGYSGEWQAELVLAADGATALSVRERATTPSPWGRLLARLLFNPEAFASTYLDELEAELARRQERGQ